MLVGVPGLPQRIFSVVLFQAAVDQRHAAVGVGPEVQLGEGLVAARGAVVAVAVGVHPRGIHQETDPVALAFRVQVVAAQAIAADGGFRADPRGALAVAGEHLDHPAGVAAVDRRGRPAQYLDALGDVEVEGRGLALAIRRTGRDAVGEQLQPADTEGRAGAVAARGDLQVLSVVLAVLHHQARYPRQDFGEVDAELAVGDLPTLDAIHRERQVEGVAGVVAAGHHHGFEAASLLALDGAGDGQAAERQGAGQQVGGEAGSGSGRHAGFRGSQGIEGALPRAGTRLPLAKPLPGRGPEGREPAVGSRWAGHCLGRA